MERHFFLDHHHKSIYCVEYIPQNGNQIKTGVLICPPIWGERIRTHRIFTNLGRELQKKNYYVLTCNYFGDGNSGGESYQLTFQSILDDLKALYEYSFYNFNVEKNIVIGYRLGSNAVIPLLDKIKVSKAILIDPLLNPLNYLKDVLRANLTSQFTRYKKIEKNRDELIKEIRANQLINVDGFLIGKEMWESFENNSPIVCNKNFTGDVLIISSEKKTMDEISGFNRSFLNTRVEFIEKEVVVTSWKKYMQRPPILFSKIFREI